MQNDGVVEPDVLLTTMERVGDRFIGKAAGLRSRFHNGHLSSVDQHRLVVQGALNSLQRDKPPFDLFFIGSLDMRFRAPITDDDVLEVIISCRSHSSDTLSFNCEVKSLEGKIYTRARGNVVGKRN